MSKTYITEISPDNGTTVLTLQDEEAQEDIANLKDLGLYVDNDGYVCQTVSTVKEGV